MRMAGKQNLKAIVFHSYSDEGNNYELRKQLKADDGVISDIFFGRREKVQSLPYPVGLNVTVKLDEGLFSILYTNMVDIRLLMDQFDADRMEHLNGKPVTAYRNQYNALVGLSARGEE
mgnify:CR=1 FL=1